MFLETEKKLQKVIDGVWYLPREGEFLPESIYDQDYLDKYTGYEFAEGGKAKDLNHERRLFLFGACAQKDGQFQPNLIKRVCDVGAGNGAFLRGVNLSVRMFAIEISSAARKELERRKKQNRMKLTVYSSIPKGKQYQYLTFWDSFEHIETPNLARETLGHAKEFVGMSLPLIPRRAIDPDTGYLLPGMRQWRHYREDEHRLYFTRDGLIRFVESEGFECIAFSRFEEWYGRQDIGSFVFRRVSQ